MSKRILLPVLILALMAAGCANQAKHLRVQPIMYLEVPGELKAAKFTVPLPPIGDPSMPAQPASPVSVASMGAMPLATTAPGTLPEKQELSVRCVRLPSGMTNEAMSRKQCLYIAVDYNDVLKLNVSNQLERNRLIDLLTGFSDANCDAWVHRVFANKATLDAGRNTGADIATAIAAGTAQVASGFASGLGLLNLVGGTAVDNYNAVIFSDKTFQVISSALAAERSKALAVVIDGSRKPLADYSFEAAMADLRRYDNACSLRQALERLGEMADAAKEVESAKVDAARSDEVAELRKEMETARENRTAAQAALNDAQTQLLAATDDAQRTALTAQLEALRVRVEAATKRIDELRAAIAATKQKNQVAANNPS